MRCKEFLVTVSAYLDGESSAVVRLEIEQHLQRCSPCARVLKTCRQTILTYRQHPVPDLPAALHQKVMDRVRRDRRSNI